MKTTIDPRAAVRMALPWLAVAAGVMVLELFLDLVAGIPYHRLVVDQSELSPDVGSTDGLVTLIGIVSMTSAAAVALFTAAVLRARSPLSPLWPVLAAIGGASALLMVDDALRGHEGLSNASGLPEVAFLGVHGVIVLVIIRRFGRDLAPELPLGLVFLAGFGGSFVFDFLVEDILELEFPGEVFLEENLKLVGILALLGLVLHLANRALATQDAPGPSGG